VLGLLLTLTGFFEECSKNKEKKKKRKKKRKRKGKERELKVGGGGGGGAAAAAMEEEGEDKPVFGHDEKKEQRENSCASMEQRPPSIGENM